MKNIKNLVKINPATYFIILTFLLTGLIKNIILVYIIVIFHELGHILIIKKLNLKITKVEIYPMGGITTINKKINSSIKEEIIISLAGIFFQFLLYLIFLLLYQNNLISPNTYDIFNTYNKTILIFNLLPIIPLDGYIFIRSLIEIYFPYKLAYYISLIISIISIILFITYNELLSLNNYLIISFLVYKIITSLKEFKYNYLRFELERYLNDFQYRTIKHEKKCSLNLLKRETYHFFKQKDTYISEKKLLKEKYQEKKYI